MESFHHHQIFYRASFENALRDDVLGVEVKHRLIVLADSTLKKAYNLLSFHRCATKQNCLHGVQSMNLCFNTAVFRVHASSLY